MMSLAVDFVLIVVAALLSISAAAKVVAPAQPREALAALGVPIRFVAAIVAATAVGEWFLAFGIATSPRSQPAQAGVLIAFLAFAVLGAVALLERRSVPCGCLGPIKTGELGVHQIAQLPPAMLFVIVVMPHAPRTSMFESAGILFVVEAAAALVVLLSIIPRWSRLRSTRRSLAASRRFYATHHGTSTVGVRS